MAAQIERERLEGIRDELGGRRWHELGIEEFAAAAGLSRMTLHRRGIGKEEIRAGFGGAAGRRIPCRRPPRPHLERARRERLRAALEATCRVDERYLGLIEGLGDELEPIFHEDGEGEVLTKGSFTEAIRRILEDGEREGTLDPGDDAEEKATLIFNAAGWTYRHMRVGHRWDPERARTGVVDLLVAGVRK